MRPERPRTPRTPPRTQPARADQLPIQPGAFGAYVVTPEPDELCARAAAAGADIVRPLHDTDYGSRDFAASDLEGNVWSFGSSPGIPARLRAERRCQRGCS